MRDRRRIDDEREAVIVAALLDLRNAKRVSEVLGEPYNLVRAVGRRNGIEPEGRGPTPERRAEWAAREAVILAALRETPNALRVARALGVSRTHVGRIAKRHGIALPARGQSSTSTAEWCAKMRAARYSKPAED